MRQFDQKNPEMILTILKVTFILFILHRRKYDMSCRITELTSAGAYPKKCCFKKFQTQHV